MQIITLTTDMGLSDHYVASLKGRILIELPDIQLVDISHLVQAFDISQAAYYLSSCIDDFPKGTIHIVGVDTEPVVNFGSSDHSSLPAILVFKDQFIVSNDNGLFSLLVKDQPYDSVWHLDDVLSNPNSYKFPAKNILIPIAIQLAKKVPLEKLASRIDGFRRLISINPVVEANLIRGNVIHIDHYGNVITNINKETFYRFGETIPFTIFFRKKEYYIDVISKTYNEVPPGERLAFFNNNDLLEIAINKGANQRNGGASNLFGLDINDTIRIEFSPEGSKNSINDLF